MDNIPSALKVFVVGGGIVLVAGTILLAVLIALRAGADDPIVLQTSQALLLPAGAGSSR